jgi:integrase
MAGSKVAVRRPNLIQRGDRWTAYLRLGGIQHWRTFPSEAQATQWLAQMRSLRGGTRSAHWTNPTFAEYARRWLHEDAALRVRPTTLARYRQLVELHLIPQFGKQRLGQITSGDVGAFVRDWIAAGPQFQTRQLQASKRKPATGTASAQITLGNSPQTIAHAVNVGSGIFRSAITQQSALVNPFSGTPRPTITHTERPWLTPAELARLFQHLDPEWVSFYVLLAGTGLRYSEAAALRWGDIDLENRRLVVTRRLARDGTEDTPKTSRSRRAVPLPATVVTQLRQHYLRSRFKAKDDRVFCTRNGTHLSDTNLRRRVLCPALRAAGLPEMGHHGFRHSFISNALAAGTPIGYVSRIVGHSSISVTMDRYGHIALDTLDEAGTRIDGFLFGEGWNNGELTTIIEGTPHKLRA